MKVVKTMAYRPFPEFPGIPLLADNMQAVNQQHFFLMKEGQ